MGAWALLAILLGASSNGAVASGPADELRKDAELLEASYLGDEKAINAAESEQLL